MTAPLAIAHVTDPHLDGESTPRERLAAVVRRLHRLPVPVDAILLTGDIAQAGPGEEPADYTARAGHVYNDVADLLAPTPALYCPGNSDDRAAFTAFIAGPATPAAARVAGEPVNQAVELRGVRFLLVDSCVPGHLAGRLADPTIAWLRAELAAHPGIPTVDVLHHHPVAVHHRVVDRLGLDPESADALAATIADYPEILAVLGGHTHSAVTTTFAGRPFVTAPGVHSRGTLPAEMPDDDAPLIDTRSAPGFALHLLADGRLTTYTEHLHDYRRDVATDEASAE